VGQLSNSPGGRLDPTYLNLNSPEHYALALAKIKKTYNKFSNVARQGAETFDDYRQRVFESLWTKPCLAIDKKVYSRAWACLWRAPSHDPFSNNSGNSLTVRYSYENRNSGAALQSVPLEDYHRTTLEQDAEGEHERQLQIEAAQEELIEIINDPTVNKSVKAAAMAYVHDEPMASAAVRFNITRQAVEQGKKTLLKKLKTKINTEGLSA